MTELLKSSNDHCKVCLLFIYSVVTSHCTVTLHTLYFLLSLLVLYCLVALIKIFMIVYKAITYRDFLNAVAIVSHRTFVNSTHNYRIIFSIRSIFVLLQ